MYDTASEYPITSTPQPFGHLMTCCPALTCMRAALDRAAVLPELLKLRAGTYLEPTRFETSSARLHGTFGLDVRLLKWNVLGLWPDDYVWRIGLGGDASRRYFSWGVTIGGWYPRQRQRDVAPAVGAEAITGFGAE